MPHCILEYSSNHIDDLNVRSLFEDLHATLLRIWAFKKEDFKSRSIEYEHYLIGDDAKENVFAALELQVMSGKKESEHKALSEAALEVLKKHFPHSLTRCVTSLSVQVVEVNKGSYSRFQS
jgi:5-carboxymethyl-2-hydroxymuconate isomerase